MQPFCSFGTVIFALLVRSRTRVRATRAFGVVMDLTKTEMAVPKEQNGRTTTEEGQKDSQKELRALS